MKSNNHIIYNSGDKIGACIYIKDVYIHNSNWVRFAEFSCHCGKHFISAIGKVKCGHTKSCGCVATKKIIEFNTTHGMANSTEFSIWTNMIQRCTNPNNTSYFKYGARGITVCNEWLNSFEIFYKDMGNRPKGYTLERKENNIGYSESNCRWATPKEQAMNRRSNLLIEYSGIIKPLKMWADELGLNYPKIIQRVNKLKWSPQKALETI